VNTKSRTNIGHGRNYSVKNEWNAKDVTQWNEHRRFVRIEFVRRCGRAEEKTYFFVCQNHINMLNWSVV
jgi:hypothetical protein